MSKTYKKQVVEKQRPPKPKRIKIDVKDLPKIIQENEDS